MKPKKICTVEELCEAVGCSLDEQETAQMRIESILSRLDDWNVIDGFSEDRLDWVFSGDETY